jgi:hypothetical protein
MWHVSFFRIDWAERIGGLITLSMDSAFEAMIASDQILVDGPAIGPSMAAV